MKGCDKLPCGCVHDGHKWVRMCEPCRLSFEETHRRWSDEHFGRAKVIDEGATNERAA